MEHNSTPYRSIAIPLIWVCIPALILLAMFWLPSARQTLKSPATPVIASTPAPPLQTAAEYFKRGDSNLDRGNYAAALADYSHAIELKPDFAEAYHNRAYTYMKQENYVPALPDLDEAIRLRPTYVNALMKRGDIYAFYYNVDRKRAIADYDRIIALGPDAYRNKPVCGHRLVVQNNGMSVGLWLSVVFSRGRNAEVGGCVEHWDR